MHDNITSSYPLNLPSDFYTRYINDNVPKKDQGDGKWYIRPHHLESLTKHPQSVKDDVLNTRYISHYDQTYGKEVKINKSEEAIENIESHLSKLRIRMKQMLYQTGKNPDVLDEM